MRKQSIALAGQNAPFPAQVPCWSQWLVSFPLCTISGCRAQVMAPPALAWMLGSVGSCWSLEPVWRGVDSRQQPPVSSGCLCSALVPGLSGCNAASQPLCANAPPQQLPAPAGGSRPGALALLCWTVPRGQRTPRWESRTRSLPVGHAPLPHAQLPPPLSEPRGALQARSGFPGLG